MELKPGVGSSNGTSFAEEFYGCHAGTAFNKILRIELLLLLLLPFLLFRREEAEEEINLRCAVDDDETEKKKR